MPISREQVLEIVKKKGPLIPAVVGKDLGLDLLFAQAFLSDLSSAKMVKVSHIKVGGSPLYYVPGQESKLQEFSERLNEKEKRAYDLLSEKKVLRDRELDPLTRICLRQIRDFAIMLEVKGKEDTEIFWKWYKCSNDEVSSSIKKMLAGTGSAKENSDQIKKKDVPPLPNEQSEKLELQQGENLQQESPQQEKAVQAAQRENPPQQQEKASQEVRPEPFIKPEPENLRRESQLQSQRNQLQNEKNQLQSQRSQLQNERNQLQSQRPVQSEPVQKKAVQRKLADAEDVKIETVDPLEQLKDAISAGDEFLGKLSNFFNQNKITITNFKVVRKGSDSEFIISVPSAVGLIDFFCKAKNKKKCNDGDLSSAFVQGQLRKLPVLFLTTGDLTKKSEEMLSREFNGMKVQKI